MTHGRRGRVVRVVERPRWESLYRAGYARTEIVRLIAELAKRVQ